MKKYIEKKILVLGVLMLMFFFSFFFFSPDVKKAEAIGCDINAITDFSLTPNPAPASGPVTVSWAANAGCPDFYIDWGAGNWQNMSYSSGSVSRNRSAAVETYTFAVGDTSTCGGVPSCTAWNDTASVTVLWVQSDIKANGSDGPITIAQGDSVTFSWTSQNATVCSIDQGIGSVSPVASGSVLRTVNSSATYTITCSNGVAQYSDSVSITANPPPPVNNPPTVNAGIDRNITLPTSSISIPAGGATASDPDSDPITLSWSNTSTPGPAPTISGGNTLTPTFGNMTTAGTYTFQLIANDGSLNSPPDTMTVTVAAATLLPPTNVGAVAGACDSGTITVSWTASAGATSYDVYRSPTSGGPYSSLGNVASSPFVNNSSLTAGNTYYYVVQARNAGGPSANSSQASAVAPSPCASPMSGSITASSCTIPSGGASCSTSLNWSVTNPVANTAVTTPINITVGTGHTGTNVPYTVAYGSRDFYLYNNSSNLDTATATASCVAGTAWSGSACRSYTVTGTAGANGTITPSSRTVAHGGTTTFTVTPNSGYSATTTGCNGGPTSLQSSSYTYTTGAITANCTVTATFSATSMSGTLTPATSACTIASGASSCTSTTLSWTTTNPVGTSSVTNNGGATVATGSATGNNGSATFTTPYNNAMGGVTTFYLYNNTVQLAMATVTTSCASGTNWDGSVCAPAAAGMSGSLTATNCTIALNASRCLTSLTWSTTNPVATSSVTSNKDNLGVLSPNYLVQNGNSGSGVPARVYGGNPNGTRNFFLYNNGVELSTPIGGVVATATCTAGSSWNGTICAASAPTTPTVNLVANPLAVATGGMTSTLTWTSSNLSGSDYCTSNFFTGNGAVSNSTGIVVTPAAPSSTYTITCFQLSTSTQVSDSEIVTVGSGVKKPIIIEN